MKLRTSLVTGAMALALSVPAAAQDASTPPALAPGKTATATAGVNLRSGPGAEHDRLTVVPEGAAVEVQECVPDWCEVTFDGTTGFVRETYLEAKQWVLQTTQEFELRAGPGKEHGAIGVVPAEAMVAVEKCVPGWCEVTFEGKTGFIETVAAAAKAPEAIEATNATEAAEATEAALAPAAEAEEKAVATRDLHLRAGAGLKHKSIGVIPAGAKVEIRACMPNRVWCEVTYGKKTGFASKRYLDISS